MVNGIIVIARCRYIVFTVTCTASFYMSCDTIV